MKKKISLILGMCLMIVGLTACGEDPKKIDYNGYTYEQLQTELQNSAQMLTSLPMEQIDQMIEQYNAQPNEEYKSSIELFTRWKEAVKEAGSYQKLGEFTITKSGKTLTCEQEIIYEERPILLTYVFTYYNMQLDDITVDPVQTLGEKMKNAGLNTLMGMGVVFTVLILISLIIYCFRIFPYLEEKKKAKQAPAVSEAAEPKSAPAVETQDNLELAAVIAAAVAAATGTSTDDFVVRSIKRRF